MPTYQYACTACGHELEAVQSFTDAPLIACPECDGGLRKVFSSVGVVFKGSGFYRTDSRAGSASDGAPSTNGSGSATPDASSSERSESKGSSDGGPSTTKPAPTTPAPATPAPTTTS